MPNNSPLASFDPFAVHPFTSYASPSPATSPLSTPTGAPAQHTSQGRPMPMPSPTRQPQATQPIFVPFRQGAHSPDLNDILRKKPTSSK
ncbi:hypothetical protein K435DRAFT_780656 [Dendrothele bispora CBS 962.96]|uniref:Uncharacterized protein n=1 Tax=Dendrothele bispora (strain CBS 962.96) TaxID=1314807 RepID=A0A4S8LPY6_DENBC|nr:hypothetical protein K435DRAFT_780656 [Dendrothele bispora CBS 962.96]